MTCLRQGRQCLLRIQRKPDKLCCQGIVLAQGFTRLGVLQRSDIATGVAIKCCLARHGKALDGVGQRHGITTVKLAAAVHADDLAHNGAHLRTQAGEQQQVGRVSGAVTNIGPCGTLRSGQFTLQRRHFVDQAVKAHQHILLLNQGLDRRRDLIPGLAEALLFRPVAFRQGRDPQAIHLAALFQRLDGIRQEGLAALELIIGFLVALHRHVGRLGQALRVHQRIAHHFVLQGIDTVGLAFVGADRNGRTDGDGQRPQQDDRLPLQAEPAQQRGGAHTRTCRGCSGSRLAGCLSSGRRCRRHGDGGLHPARRSLQRRQCRHLPYSSFRARVSDPPSGTTTTTPAWTG